MELTKASPLSINVIYLYDMLSLSKVRLDDLKEKMSIQRVAYLKDPGMVLLGDGTGNWNASIESTKLSYNDENRCAFEERDLSILYNLFSHLPQLSVKAYGINLHMEGTICGAQTAGQYITDNFLQNRDELQKNLGSEIFATSTRIFLGQTDDYQDIRLFPVDLQENSIHIQYHRHKEIRVADPEKLTQDTKELIKVALTDLPKFVAVL